MTTDSATRSTAKQVSDVEMPAEAPSTSRASRIPAILVITFVVAIAIGNVWWLDAYRSGLPFNIDEAGYMAEAFRFGDAVRSGSLRVFADVWTSPNAIGPILPTVTGILRGFTGLGPWALLATQQVFCLITAGGTYLLARQMMTRGRALLSVVMVASLPGLVIGGRLFYLAVPAAAMMVVLIATQMRAAPFDSTRWSLLWGLMLGLTSLTRTMVLALLLGPLVVVGLQLLAGGLRRRRVANIALGLAVGVAVSSVWYAFTWRVVLDYLTDYGYGQEAGPYGDGHRLLSSYWWTTRFTNLLNQDLYLPIGASLLLVLMVGLGHRLASHLPIRISFVSRRSIAGDRIAVALVIGIDYVVLSSSRNSGSYFELPLAPLLVVLVLSMLPVSRPNITTIAVITALASSILSVAGAFGLIPRSAMRSSVIVAGRSFTTFERSNGALAGPKMGRVSLGGTFWGNCGGATVTCFYGLAGDMTRGELRSWTLPSRTLISTSFRIAGLHDREPVVFFAYQGPWLNTNTVALETVRMHLAMPIGALSPPTHRHPAPLRVQLEQPRFGQPNIVIAGIPPTRPGTLAGPGSPAVDLQAVSALLTDEGFELVATMPVRGAQPMGFWWKNR